MAANFKCTNVHKYTLLYLFILEKSCDKKVSISRHLPQANVQPVTATTATTTTANAAPVKSGMVETSPMVGVYYVAPSPNDAPFIKVGQQIQAGDSLGIIEAMKIMNPLEATQSGIIAEILVQNGDVVHFGQPIVRYES